MKYDLVDIIDAEKNQKILDSFCDVVGIAAAIIDLEGNIITGSRWKRICTEFHRVNETTSKKCLESDTVLSGRLAEGSQYSLYRCKNGLTDAASPIIVNNEHIANAFVGQFLLEKPDTGFFKKQANKFGFDEKKYLNALEEVPIVNETKVTKIINFLVNYSQVVAKMVIEHEKQMEIEKRLSQSAQEILEVSVPVIKIWEGIVVAPLIGTLDSQRTQLFMEKLLNKSVESKAQVALIDITGVPTLDTVTAQHLLEAVNAAGLLGTKVILTGIRPSIAQTMVNLGINMSDMQTCASLATGVKMALEMTGAKIL